MSELERIADQLRRGMEGESWHGPAVLEVLDGVTPTEAQEHPIAGVHSIWEIVLHMCGGYRLVLRRLQGDATQLTEQETWPVVPEATEANWQGAIAELRSLNEQMRHAVLAYDAQRLEEPLVAEPPYTAYTQFVGATQHDLYHAGQMAVLKRALMQSRSA